MKSVPKHLKNIVDFLENLPGIGPKTAKRLGFYFLRLPSSDLNKFAESINQLKKTTRYCKNCFNLCEDETCVICLDESRKKTTITVVEDVLDLLSFESGQFYHGLYHVLHGRIDPLNYIGPEDIFIDQLIKRLQKSNGQIKEIIIATNPDTEGEATAMYLYQKITETTKSDIKITRLAYGLPIGADLEYADYMTLKKALEGRKSIK